MKKELTKPIITQDQISLSYQRERNANFTTNNHSLWLQKDKLCDVRIRLGSVNNVSSENYNEKKATDLTGVYNGNTGCITLAYTQNNPKGLIVDELTTGTNEYQKQNNKYDIKDRSQLYNTNSTTQSVRLTYPFIWTGEDGKSCGFNYVPLNNAITITGNTNSGQPVMLGYQASNPSVLYPVLKPGEISISGYGNNFIHWAQSDKITIYCKSEAGEENIDDPNYLDNTTQTKLNVANCELEMSLNANDRFIEIKATEDASDINEENNRLSNNSQPTNGHQFTKILITPTDIQIITTDDEGNDCNITVAPDKIIQQIQNNNNISTITTQGNDIVVDTRDNNNVKTNTITINNQLLDIIANNENNSCNVRIENNAIQASISSDEEDGKFLNNIYATAEETNNTISQITETETSQSWYSVTPESIKIKTKKFEVEAEEIDISSTKEMNLWSDDCMNIAVPSGDKEITRKDINGNTYTINAKHNENDEHEQEHEDGSIYKFKLDISGCDINIKGNDHDKHGTVISSDDVG